MLEKLMRLYTAYMLFDVRSPVPHLAGPPGVGKSETVQQLATLLGVNLHTINVSRLSPLEIEGVQMPVGDVSGDDYRLRMLHSPIWKNLKEGDIVLWDEYLRGFPEVYNGLLDIFTSRQVAGFTLPKVFFVAASNSVVTYDPALEDRLLHIFVPDIRTNKNARIAAYQRFIEETGLHPQMRDSDEMVTLFENEVLPMYGILDQFKHRAKTGSTQLKGKSMRNLVGQVKLRELQSQSLKELVASNNRLVASKQEWQYLVYCGGVPPQRYANHAKQLLGSDKLSAVQLLNVRMNLQLIAAEKALTPEQKETTDDLEF